MPEYEQIEVDYEAGTVREVQMHDGSRIVLRKLEEDYDPADPMQALERLLTEDDWKEAMAASTRRPSSRKKPPRPKSSG